MSRADYLLGWVLFAAVVACAVVVAAVVVRRRLGHLDRLEGRLAGGLIGVSAYLGMHLLPLAAGVMSRASVLVVAVAGAAATLALPRAAPEADATPRPVAGPDSPLSWALGVGAAVVAAVAALAAAREWSSLPPAGVDTLTFHLPNVARWMESGSLWQIDQFIPLQVQGYYPNHGDVLILGTTLPWDNDFLLRIPMIALLAASAVALWAVGRELAAPGGTRLAVTAALLSLPIFALSTISRALPDVMLVFGLAAALLFALRAQRSGRRSDLVLAGLGLGLALGTKWYGLPAAAIAAAAMGFAAYAATRTWRTAVEHAVIPGGLALATGGIWMVRNVVEVGNPVFPAPLPGLDTPRDVVTEQVGFKIADYLGDPDVLFGALPDEVIAGLGWAPAVLAVVLVAGLALLRRELPGRVLLLAGLAVLGAVVYVFTPNTALGFEGDPAEAEFNTRYAIPALLACGAAVMWMGRHAVVRVAEAGLLVAVLLAVGDGFAPLGARRLAVAAVLLALAAAVILVARRSRPLALAACVLAVVGALGYGWRMQTRVNDVRYATADDPVLTAVERASASGPQAVAITGDWNARGTSPVWPAYGPRIENTVEVIAYDARGFLTNYARQAPFTAALERVDPDLLIVGRGLDPRPDVVPREQQWAAAAGFRPVATTLRLVLMTR